MKTGIVIVTFNKLDYTKLCIESIRRFTNKDSYEIIVVDNASSDDTTKWLSSQKDLKVIMNTENLGFPKACNQGIHVIDKDCDSVLLLNNDTVVTANWLTNLRTALLSDDSIGAVGSITNNCTYFQNMHTDYKNLDEMQVFAYNHNVSDRKKWEERLKLIGYCMLIKRTVINQIGDLDERFSPGNYEDNDYSLRIRNAGYRLLFCKDTFIHHFGSTSFKENSSFGKILKLNHEKFMEKWNYDSDLAEYIDRPVANMINKYKDEPIRVLEVGCRCGGTLLKVKYKYPNAKLYGVEGHGKEREYASNLVNTFATLKELQQRYSEKFFDVIILSNMNENDTIDVVLKQITPYLKKDGVLISVLPNLFYNQSTNRFFQGRLEKKESKYIELENVMLDFSSTGFEEVNPLLSIGEEPCDLDIYIKVYDQKIASANEKMFRIGNFYMISTFTKKEGLDMQIQEIVDNLNQDKVTELEELTLQKEEIKHALRRIENDIETKESVAQVLEWLADNEENLVMLAALLDQNIIYKVEVLNQLALTALHVPLHEMVIPLLEHALDLEPFDTSTLYNLAFVLTQFGEIELAKGYLGKISTEDKNTSKMVKDLMNQLNINHGGV